MVSLFVQIHLFPGLGYPYNDGPRFGARNLSGIEPTCTVNDEGMELGPASVRVEEGFPGSNGRERGIGSLEPGLPDHGQGFRQGKTRYDP